MGENIEPHRSVMTFSTSHFGLVCSWLPFCSRTFFWWGLDTGFFSAASYTCTSVKYKRVLGMNSVRTEDARLTSGHNTHVLLQLRLVCRASQANFGGCSIDEWPQHACFAAASSCMSSFAGKFCIQKRFGTKVC